MIKHAKLIHNTNEVLCDEKKHYEVLINCLFFKKHSWQFKLPKHRFKKCQNGPFRFFGFKFVSVAQFSRISFRIAPECTIYCPWSQILPSSFKIRFKCCLDAPFSIKCHCFHTVQSC